jgi:hypothetical protein
MKWKGLVVLRVLLGGLILVPGILNVVGLTPGTPTMLTPEARALVSALHETGLSSIVPFLQIPTAVLLISGRYTPLALLLMTPLLVAILLVHVVVAPITALPPAVMSAMLGYLIWSYRDSYRPLLKARYEAARA